MIIRQANQNDARRISYLIQKNTENVKKNNYSKKQIETWKAANSPGAIKDKLKERVIFCAFENNKLIGTIGLQDNEVVGLYVRYSKIGRGVGKKLLNHLENYAKKNQIKTLELTSTPSANSFYQRNGFTPQEPVLVKVNGVDFQETKNDQKIEMRFTPKDGFPYYLSLTHKEDVRTLFKSELSVELIDSLKEGQENYSYAPGKWSIKQIIGHIIDHERIKIHRGFLLSRKQDVQLWGYDQNALIENSRFHELPMESILQDYQNVRKASISFIDSLSKEQLELNGNAREYVVKLEDFLKTIIGHEVHHLKVIREKYIKI